MNCSGSEENKSQSRAQDSLAEEVPHKLYVVPNSDLIQVRYLLVYTEKSNSSPSQRAQDSLAEEVPHKLYVVPNSDLIQVRYLLVYTEKSNSSPSQRLTQRNSGLLSWLGRHKMAASLATYAVVLVAVGLSRSPTFLRLWQDICRTIGIR
ncbi:protein mono-ADP-ribosyltransferase PARP16-like [Macrosteles quadrilineatus]|uniref:protein mono-ADP-ribosyltransferase PARP16-like n=1 Tax=Macrosteles quadrilineatus TaxID=74068 RepID=UPI0023E1A826|nr:protein mono-ADP-ribosyltransferase PARP16-like [Macrosteles quadrilineatus]